MKKLYPVLLIMLAFLYRITAQTPTVQDCLGAIPLISTIYHQDSSYSGEGNYPNEISSAGCPNSCLVSGEKNGIWYIFTVQYTCDLCFNIIPNSSSDDYDWAVYNITNSPCDSIYSDLSIQASCNYSANMGVTGANGYTNLTCASANDHAGNAMIPVNAGETYVLYVLNYSNIQNGYTLDFTCTDSIINTNLFLYESQKTDIILSPNPVSETTTLTFTADANKRYRFQVFDMTGKPVLESDIGEAIYGRTDFNLSVSSLKSGSYFLVLYADNEIAGRTRMMVIK